MVRYMYPPTFSLIGTMVKEEFATLFSGNLGQFWLPHANLDTHTNTALISEARRSAMSCLPILYMYGDEKML